MEGWYQFGYDGFPSGEVRRRFYCQRDDPCDSEEEQEVYNDNDRPVYYYPMHESEEASSMEDEVEELPLPPTIPFSLRPSVWDSYPGHCGSASVVLRAASGGETEGGDAYFFLHGGILAVTGRVVNTSAVLRVESRVDCVPGNEAVSVVPLDASLAKAICFTGEEPFAAASATSMTGEIVTENVTVPPRRFGHCAVVIPSSRAVDILLPNYRANCEVHLTFVIGGAFADHVPKMLHDVRIRGLVMCEPWLCVTVLRRGEPSGRLSASSAHALTPISPVAQWTLHSPLTGLPPFIATPRVFATLTPWPMTEKDSNLVSYAYLGGSLNGWDPLPLFGLWLLHVDTKQWVLSSSLLETFGEEPPSRFGHSAVIVHTEELYVFGGIGLQREYLNDLVVLNCRTRVWREVFVPSAVTIPSRAFHSCLLLPYRSALVIVGGEAVGRHESSVWSYNVDCGNWCRMTFPLLDSAMGLLQAKGDDAATNCVIIAAKLLCEREQSSVEGREVANRRGLGRKREEVAHHNYRNTGADSPRFELFHWKYTRAVSFSAVANEGSTFPPLSAYYFAAMHGSLLQVLCMQGGIIVMGGTKSPGVTSISWIPARNYSLKESAALWIGMHQPHPFPDVGTRGPGVRTDAGALRGSVNLKRCTAQNGGVSLVERSLAEDQLEQWQHNARKRLREQ
ncbi:hypothetical protein TraAM80_07054 [Trypanosoma rangeli]|uniref:Uncharacterized protein n=1 Tax=Trypanosoma rangeli TaxID=5698 RepID=A0A422N7G7_TRYRA|nr:uncharacterized protein TraAM80_07054 [Trypanosoma rangeli]RNF01403.1 hypothetical protein TraAM80_07054 [Trypanosoma rangeli]|eukprot:RNF01403.1 hypothetical protein TraAM80_07054 [Trypanosoma rangeli]